MNHKCKGRRLHVCSYRTCTDAVFLIALIDIDECGEAGLNNCDVNATCKNTAPGFSCACKPGYTGNGTDCTGNYYLMRTAK